ncbi:hypothetical protein GCM10023259_082860 [Thermocatellispora tengchongensis]
MGRWPGGFRVAGIVRSSRPCGGASGVVGGRGVLYMGAKYADYASAPTKGAPRRPNGAPAAGTEAALSPTDPGGS